MVLFVSVLRLVQRKTQFCVVVRYIHSPQQHLFAAFLYLQFIAYVGRFVLKGRPADGVVPCESFVYAMQKRYRRQSDSIVCIYYGCRFPAKQIHPYICRHCRIHIECHGAVGYLSVP